MTDRYENIRKALAMTEDLNDLMCPHSAAGRPERFPARACIFAGECGCAYGAEWSRALRLAAEARVAELEAKATAFRDAARLLPHPNEPSGLTAETGDVRITENGDERG